MKPGETGSLRSWSYCGDCIEDNTNVSPSKDTLQDGECDNCDVATSPYDEITTVNNDDVTTSASNGDDVIKTTSRSDTSSGPIHVQTTTVTSQKINETGNQTVKSEHK